MSLFVIAFHHPDCNGEGDERCYGFVAHADNIPEALVFALEAGLPADTGYAMRTLGPIPDRFIDPSYWGRILTAEETCNIPEPKEFANYENAQWN